MKTARSRHNFGVDGLGAAGIDGRHWRTAGETGRRRTGPCRSGQDSARSALPWRDGPFLASGPTPSPPPTAGLAVVPDGCVDIIWIDGEFSRGGTRHCRLGIADHPWPRHRRHAFPSRRGARWLGLPMSEIVGGRVALSEFWGVRANEIAQRIGDASTTAERMSALETALARLAPDQIRRGRTWHLSSMR